MLVSDILSEAYRKLGRPSQTDMPYIDLIAVVKEVWRGLSLDLRMSARGHVVDVGNWVVPTSREMSSAVFTQGDYIIPVSCEWRPVDSDSELSSPVEIVAMEMIDSDASRPSVAFYDSFSKLKFSDIDETLYNREYRFTYEPLNDVDVDQTTDLIGMPPLFISYLADEAAVRALDYIKGSETWPEERERLRGILTASLMENKGRFTKWRLTQFGNKLTRKRGVPRQRYTDYY